MAKLQYPQAPARFTSPIRRLLLILEPITKVLVNNELVTKPGRHVQFDNFEAYVDDPETIKIMMNKKEGKKPAYGNLYICPAFDAIKGKEIPDPTDSRAGFLEDESLDK